MKVQLVSKTTGIGKYEGLTSEEIIAAIARHGEIKNDNGRLVKYLISHKHWSPLDMINFTFEVETSRAIARQWLRHKSLNPQEHSQRYSDKVEFENIELRMEHPTNRQSSTEVFDPILETWGKNRPASDVIQSTLNVLENLYFDLLEAGVAKECARMILPECTKTILSFNGTLRSWLSFLNVRLDCHSQKEIVDLATEVGMILEEEMPNVFGQLDWKKGMFM